MLPDQLEFFKLRYEDAIISPEEEQELGDRIADLQLKPFEFHNFVGKRRVLSFGWRYVFDGSGLQPAEEIPPFLIALRERIGRFSGLVPESFQHVMVSEYAPGAGIGWHKDRSVFEDIVGLSLLSPARLRFRRRNQGRWERFSKMLEPRSAYLLSGPVRSEWEHSIPPADALRYSITFRTFKIAPR